MSIMLNIAKGSGKFTKADKKNYYVMAKGSVFEGLAWCNKGIKYFQRKSIKTLIPNQKIFQKFCMHWLRIFNHRIFLSPTHFPQIRHKKVSALATSRRRKVINRKRNWKNFTFSTNFFRINRGFLADIFLNSNIIPVLLLLFFEKHRNCHQDI